MSGMALSTKVTASTSLATMTSGNSSSRNTIKASAEDTSATRRPWRKITRNYYWEKMAASVDRFIKSCNTCQRTKSSTQKPFGLLSPIPPPMNKFQTLTIDFIGPLRTTAKGYNGIMTITDPLTKGVTLEPMNFSYGAMEIAEIFFKRIISRQGLPLKIISDRDPRFTGEFWKTLFNLLGTEISLSTAYHPQSDGQSERTNRTLEEVLRGQVNATQDDWDRHLPWAEFAINDSVSPATGFSPFQLIYGMHPRKPLDPPPETKAPAAQEFITTMTTAITTARENILKAQDP